MNRQKRNADKHGRANVLSFEINDLVLLSTVNLPKRVVTNVGSSKLLPKFIGPFRVLHRRDNAYTIELPCGMRTHPAFYVGRLCPYHQSAVSSEDGSDYPFQDPQKIFLVTNRILMLNLEILMPGPRFSKPRRAEDSSSRRA